MNIQVNGLNLFYVKKGEGEPLILVHGNGESHKIFEKTIDELSEKYAVYALDMRGHGESDKIDKLHYEDMADDIIEFIEKNNIEKPYYFGFSDGGIVGLIASYKKPLLFKKMLIAGANTHPKAMKLRWRLFFKFWHFFSRDKLLKVMLKEPKITSEQLNSVIVKTVVIMGERDMIKNSDGQFIANNIKDGQLITLKKERHGSYVLNNDKLTNILNKHLLNE